MSGGCGLKEREEVKEDAEEGTKDGEEADKAGLLLGKEG